MSACVSSLALLVFGAISPFDATGSKTNTFTDFGAASPLGGMAAGALGPSRRKALGAAEPMLCAQGD